MYYGGKYPHSQPNHIPFLKQIHQSNHLWTSINHFDHTNTQAWDLHQLITIAYLLEEHIQLEVQHLHLSTVNSDFSSNEPIAAVIVDTVNFYSQPEVQSSSSKKSFPSFTNQIFSPSRILTPQPRNTNFSSVLQLDPYPDISSMEIDLEESQSSVSRSKAVTWSTDEGIASLSKDLFSNLKEYQAKTADFGELESELPDYKQPKDIITSNTKLNQRIRFNLICHRGTVADIPSVKLFKSFTSTLKKVDPSIIILPFHLAKQHYSSLVTLKQIQSMDRTTSWANS